MEIKDKVRLSLETKIFKTILIFNIIISIINIVANSLIGFSFWISLKWVALAILALVILVLSRKKNFKQFQFRLSYFLFLIFVFFPFGWFQSGGSANNSLAYIFLTTIAISFLFKRGKVRDFLFFSLVLIFIILYCIEFFYPHLIIFHSQESQFYDRLIQIPLILYASYLMLERFSDAYNREKENLKLLTKKLKIANQKLENIAHRDSLTKKYNRRAFDQEIKAIFKEKLHFQKKITLVLIDIDNFKDINDNYGHDKGDEVLVAISQRLENFMPAQSLIARWGGDEFAVISYEDLYQTQFYLEKYYGEMENLSKELGFKISFSAGLSSLNQEDTVEQLFKRVDKVLYESKREGKARYKLS